MKTRTGRTLDPLPMLRRSLFAMVTVEQQNRELMVSRSRRSYVIAAVMLMISFSISRVTSTGFEYQSSATIQGLPWLDIGREAKGVIAIGGTAQGFVAIGGLAVGVFTLGGLSIGLFSIGGGSLGLVLSIGGAAIGFYCFGGAALGAHAFGDASVGYFTSCGITQEVLVGSD